MLGCDLDLAGRDPEQRVGVDDEPHHAADATRRQMRAPAGSLREAHRRV
jgi:hypothetical protein